MKLGDCYRLLELRADARPDEIKASYRRLVRRYHPDVNPQNPQEAHRKFIQITTAYKSLLQASHRSTRTATKVKPKPRYAPKMPELSVAEKRLKFDSYKLLQQLLKEQRFARSVALVEGLAQRFPFDVEVRQWQAITYQQWGQQLIRDRGSDRPTAARALEKARIYLKKAAQTDPHNRSLWAKVERNFRELEQLY
ncbi:J domain-containing protein [Lusitaniella coriacea LEGE 07157]|uniref:J domain-containing protein n=1 Tax=Lusitaniella coriacea LEGE 07157 TaxID=945747 RepID=A0A8J7J3L3_9CYAN|nr:J domain-containing protein [Lusitaniella coriacea]MBE9117004.1 J domain-containing protein [Lusitaniella coriacea LEGE 07157]